MNGKELLTRLAHEKMPDPDQVRNQIHACEETREVLAFAAARGSFLRRLRWRTAVLIAAASLIFAGAATAVGIAIYDRIDRVDVGGGAELVLLPYDCPEAQEYQRSQLSFMVPLFVNPNTTDEMHWVGALSDAEDARRLNDELAKKLFLADGSPFPYDFIVGDSGGFFRGNARGHVLFDANGNEIYAILAWQHGSDPFTLSIQTVPQMDERQAWEIRNASLEHALYVLGAEFALPTVDEDLFNAPTFHVLNFYSFRRVQVRYLDQSGPDNRYSSRDIVINIEPLRDDGTVPFTRTVLGTAEVLEVAGTTVYRITSGSGHMRRADYVWSHNGLAFELYPPTGWGSEFTEEQIYDLIAEMLR